VGVYLVELPDPGEEDAVREAGEVGEDIGREEATRLGSSLGLCDLRQRLDRPIEGRARLTRLGRDVSGNGGLAPASGLGLAGHRLHRLEHRLDLGRHAARGCRRVLEYLVFLASPPLRLGRGLFFLGRGILHYSCHNCSKNSAYIDPISSYLA
jgi:hypothetical protein